MNDHGSIIQNSPKCGKNPNAHQLLNDKMWYSHMVEQYLTIKRNEALFNTDEP